MYDKLWRLKSVIYQATSGDSALTLKTQKQEMHLKDNVMIQRICKIYRNQVESFMLLIWNDLISVFNT